MKVLKYKYCSLEIRVLALVSVSRQKKNNRKLSPKKPLSLFKEVGVEIDTDILPYLTISNSQDGCVSPM